MDGLTWHAQPTRLTLRRVAPGGYERGDPFVAVLQVYLLGQGVAYMHAALGVDGQRLTRKACAEVAALLLKDWGVKQVLMVRGGQMELKETERFCRNFGHPGAPRTW